MLDFFLLLAGLSMGQKCTPAFSPNRPLVNGKLTTAPPKPINMPQNYVLSFNINPSGMLISQDGVL